MEKELKELVESGKIIVGVYQNTDDDLNHSKKYNLKNIWKDEKINLIHLLEFLYRKQIQKSNRIKISYKYNYSDVQEITVIDSMVCYDGSYTYTKFVFYNIQTNCGFLCTDLLEMKLDK